MDTKEDLLNVLRNDHATTIAEAPEHNRARTDHCPSIGYYPLYARTAWPDELRGHATACVYCQARVKGVWAAECPGGRTLREYLTDRRFVNRKALDELKAQCWSCGAKLALIEASGSWIVTLSECAAFIHQRRTQQALAKDANRDPIRLTEVLDNPRVTIRIYEVSTHLLEVSLTSEDATLANKSFEVRLTGEQYDSRLRVTLANQISDSKWTGSQRLELTENRLNDLTGRMFVSLSADSGDNQRPEEE